MIKALTLLIFISSSFLIACKPLFDTGLMDGWFNQGTELVAGDYAPQDHWSGEWRMVNIWAEWCKPCWQEIPQLNQFFTLQGSEGVKLIGFNFDELDQTELVILKEKMSIQFPILTIWPKDWVKPEIKGLPATVIISPNDEIKTILWGPQSLSSLHKAIEVAKKEE
jgi:thiol-disulfide isomerase/thioredoxin